MLPTNSVCCQASMRHPFPKSQGSRLIRDLHKSFQSHFVSHILIAISGGKDSMALAHALIKYGRNCIPRDRIKLLTIDHQWHQIGLRDKDPIPFIKDFAKRWSTPLLIEKIEPSVPKGVSLEDYCRKGRLQIFKDLSIRHRAHIVTGHTQDDLAETLLWRLCTSTKHSTLGGMRMHEGVQFRPLLRTRGQACLRYLAEEGQDFVEDSSNTEVRFLRGRMRGELFPVLEKLFPRCIEKLGAHALGFQERQRLEVGQEKALEYRSQNTK